MNEFSAGVGATRNSGNYSALQTIAFFLAQKWKRASYFVVIYL